MAIDRVVKALVENFRGQSEVYESPSYNETQLRRDFLDKVIKALGWDVDNEQVSSETFREVVHEDRLAIDGQSKAVETKFPDYCVQLGGRKLFYIEAKKPSVNINADARPAYQVRRYGWTAKMPVCLLSDFAEFAVYDTTVKPSPKDDATTARIFYCRYEKNLGCYVKYQFLNVRISASIT
ncbi:MAG: restriction endonuclease subunit M [Bacteroidales bacterium]